MDQFLHQRQGQFISSFHRQSLFSDPTESFVENSNIIEYRRSMIYFLPIHIIFEIRYQKLVEMNFDFKTDIKTYETLDFI